ncbi:MAG: hypothetical protein K2O08_02780 [Clostridia bacterium]|nr:hypothetical protein [Clostridia bacterium]
MIVTFSGHMKIKIKDVVREKLFETLKNLDTSKQIVFYLSVYGDFNKIARECCEKYKKEINQNVKLVFITPYLFDNSLNNSNFEGFDEVINPECENVHTLYRLSPKCIWMADKADVLIAYVNSSLGGAADMLRYMLRKGNKTCINIGNYGIC